MPSSGGLLNAISFEISPVVLFAAAALELAAVPKRPDIVREMRLRGEVKKREETAVRCSSR